MGRCLKPILLTKKKKILDLFIKANTGGLVVQRKRQHLVPDVAKALKIDQRKSAVRRPKQGIFCSLWKKDDIVLVGNDDLSF